MSQKVAVTRVRVHGRPYLGTVVNDGTGEVTSRWSRSPDEVMDWLCSGFQTRFNQRRSCRSKFACLDGEKVLDAADEPLLVPIGRSVTDISDSQARAEFSYLAAIPSLVLEATGKAESSDWFAAARRRKTSGGSMPGFRSRKRHDARFVCWYNGGKGATFTKTGRRSGVVHVGSINPAGTREADQPARWSLAIHVRLSQPIRGYTSVRVNWTQRELVFVNEPLALVRTADGQSGYDRGVAHALADSNGAFHDAPDTSALVATRKRHQRAMARSKRVAEKEHRRFWESNRHQRHKAAAAKATTKKARVNADWRQKISTEIARKNSLVAFEDLRLASMTARGKGTGTAAKRGLNRSLLSVGLGELAEMTRSKVQRTGGVYVPVNPAYTSQRCHSCGHTAKENRESQAVFRCVSCGHTDNADTNAAKNILAVALTARAMADTGSGDPSASSRRPPTAQAA